jgi:hypothetical protein
MTQFDQNLNFESILHIKYISSYPDFQFLTNFSIQIHAKLQKFQFLLILISKTTQLNINPNFYLSKNAIHQQKTKIN